MSDIRDQPRFALPANNLGACARTAQAYASCGYARRQERLDHAKAPNPTSARDAFRPRVNL